MAVGTRSEIPDEAAGGKAVVSQVCAVSSGGSFGSKKEVKRAQTRPTPLIKTPASAEQLWPDVDPPLSSLPHRFPQGGEGECERGRRLDSVPTVRLDDVFFTRLLLVKLIQEVWK